MLRWLLVSLAALSGCGLLYEARPIDAAPIVSTLEAPRPPGEIEAWLGVDTGGDQMRARPLEAGLTLTVEVGDRRYDQTIASCRELGKGNIIPLPEGAADQAFCDERTYVLALEAGRAVVWIDAIGGEVLAEIPLG